MDQDTSSAAPGTDAQPAPPPARTGPSRRSVLLGAGAAGALTAGTKVAVEAGRTAGYRAWTEAVEKGGGNDQFWLLTSRVDDGSPYPDCDGYRMVWDASGTNPVRETVVVLSAHAKRVATGG